VPPLLNSTVLPWVLVIGDSRSSTSHSCAGATERHP
jgi:hypothetical protein